jgi:DNA-directed RNA polymerase beta subunit
VSSFSPLQTGDKITTRHGQKGVAWVMPDEDMIYGKHPKYGNVCFDVIMACSSIVNRLTTGQIVETVRTIPVPLTGRVLLDEVFDAERMLDEGTVDIFDGTTGLPVQTLFEGRLRPTQATFGLIRMFNQVKMVRERHHMTHNVAGRSLKVPKGRSRGGGVNLGEMDIQSLSSVGMRYTLQNIVDGGDITAVDVCYLCGRIALLCTFGDDGYHMKVKLPYGSLMLDITTAITQMSATSR